MLGAGRDFRIDANLDAAEHLLNDLAGDDQLFGLALDDAARLLAADRADLALQAAHPGLARVVANQEADRVRGKFDLLRSESVLLGLAADQVLIGDVLLVLFGIAVQVDDLHAVAQRIGNGIQLIRRGDEQHLGEIEWSRPDSCRGS